MSGGIPERNVGAGNWFLVKARRDLGAKLAAGGGRERRAGRQNFNVGGGFGGGGPGIGSGRAGGVAAHFWRKRGSCFEGARPGERAKRPMGTGGLDGGAAPFKKKQLRWDLL
jgi:hypothetical protein